METVNHPEHYNSGDMECIDAIVATQGKEDGMAFCICNAFKYLWRHKKKKGVEDIRKAIWYLTKYVELKEPNNSGGVESTQLCSEIINQLDMPLKTKDIMPEKKHNDSASALVYAASLMNKINTHREKPIDPEQPPYLYGEDDFFESPKLRSNYPVIDDTTEPGINASSQEMHNYYDNKH